MPAISKIRFTNVVYEDGNKRYNDELFHFDGYNSAILLENGGGKTVFIQSALQAVLPRTDLAGRRIKETFSLENGPAHIAIEWIVNEKPRQYAVTCVTLFLAASGVDSIHYVYDYSANDPDGIAQLPFVRQSGGKTRPAEKGEMQDYYQGMCTKRMSAHTFSTIKKFHHYLEEQLHVIPGEWDWIAKINQSEGGIEHFFDECKSTSQLFDQLLIPVVEHGMSSFTEGEFARTFQARRESFKRYKELKETVEENSSILHQLDAYVAAYAKLHEKQVAYEAVQGEAKALWMLGHAQEAEQRLAEQQITQQTEQWDLRRMKHVAVKASIELAKNQQELGAIEQQLTLAQEDMQTAREELQASELQYYSLQYSEYRLEKRHAEARVKVAQEQLEQLGRSPDERETEEAWLHNGSRIRAWYQQQEETLNDRFQTLTQEREAVVAQLAEGEKLLNEQELELREREKELVQLETQEQERLRRQNEIRKEVLSNLVIESMEDRLVQWVERERELDERCVSLTQLNKELKRQTEEKQGELDKTRERSREESETRSRIEERIDSQRLAHTNLLMLLVGLRPAWERLKSIYDHQSSIERILAEETDKLTRDKEHLLQQERLAFRFVDDYGQQASFYADPYLAEQIKRWSNQFTLLRTGIEYVTELGEAGVAQHELLWAVTLITLESERAQLFAKVTGISDRLQYPVRVLSTDDAAGFIRDHTETAGVKWVEPNHWRTNANAGAFSQWKESVSLQAMQVKNQRVLQEKRINAWEDAGKAFRQYLEAYPLEKIQELEQELDNHQEALRVLEHQTVQLQLFIRDSKDQIETNAKRLQEERQEWQQIIGWIEKGRQYVQLSQEIQGIQQVSAELKEEIERVRGRNVRRRHECERLRKSAGELGETQLFVRSELTNLQGQDLYNEVVGLAPEVSDDSLEVLKVERQQLQLRRLQITQSRRELEIELQAAQEKEQGASRGMERLESEREGLLLDIEFPSQGMQKMVELSRRMREQQECMKRFEKESRDVETRFNRQETKLGLMKERFSIDYPGYQPTVFFVPLKTASDDAAREEMVLKIEKQELDKLTQHIRTQLASIRSAISTLVEYKQLHGFENPVIQAKELSDEARKDFSYHRERMTQEIVSQLKAQYDSVDRELEELRRTRERFKTFGRKNIQDVKLREMAEQGVEQARSYEDIMEFQSIMSKKLRLANHVAEETMRSHNEELEQYIIHVHAHLKQVTTELKEIPVRTRVKIETEWKPIYTFTIPEWEEQEGKGAIREHLDWILGQLEHGKYQNEQGQEIEANVRKDLEKWLDTKQLLQMVLREKTMKVTCRKVNNENMLSRAAYSWEQSNNWSGGEKWSKNMTLFLGVLNYIAEKRQHIQGGMKRHRAVILDNPFGKASSDHVLGPVFFIAEQLGFQIIALTAHATGKFLQDYFPVVYSCKLRQAAGSNKQIMTKEKTINHAFFRDHEPVVMERLGEVKQIELF